MPLIRIKEMRKLPALTRNQVRAIDKTAIAEYGMPGVVLMENAGSRAAILVNQLSPPGPIEILCGGGNNGGDGYVIARHLQLMGRSVSIISTVPISRLKGDARINAIVAERAEIPILSIESESESLAAPELGRQTVTVVDALLGTGSRGQLRGRYHDLVEIANLHSGLRIAIDIPTGLDCDTGRASTPTFTADHTITFVADKVGFKKNNADKYVGVVHKVCIGVPAKLLATLQSDEAIQ